MVAHHFTFSYCILLNTMVESASITNAHNNHNDNNNHILNVFTSIVLRCSINARRHYTECGETFPT